MERVAAYAIRVIDAHDDVVAGSARGLVLRVTDNEYSSVEMEIECKICDEYIHTLIYLYIYICHLDGDTKR